MLRGDKIESHRLGLVLKIGLLLLCHAIIMNLPPILLRSFGKQCSQFLGAMHEEMVHKNQTCQLVKYTKWMRAIECKWLYKKKEGLPGVSSKRFKARLVAKGNAQRESVDFHVFLW